MRSGVGPEQNAVLILVEKFLRGERLAAQFADARGHIDVHIGESIQVLGHVLQILGEIPEVQRDELRLGMARDHAVARLDQLGVARENLAP